MHLFFNTSDGIRSFGEEDMKNKVDEYQMFTHVLCLPQM